MPRRALLLLALLGGGCNSMVWRHTNELVRRASADLGCERAVLEVVELEAARARVTGCGRGAVYAWSPSPTGGGGAWVPVPGKR
jgi:hypothetical protein